MTEFTIWDRGKNIAYIVALIMIEQIELLHNQYEEYKIYVLRLAKAEYWVIIVDDESLLLRFDDTCTYSTRVGLVDSTISELKSIAKRKNDAIMPYRQLFICLAEETVKYRQRIKLRWGNLTVSVKPVGDNLAWFLKYKNTILDYTSIPTDDEAEQVIGRFNALIGVADVD